MTSRKALSSRKRPANVSINNNLLDKARRHGISLSQALEDRLAELSEPARLRENIRGIGSFDYIIICAGTAGCVLANGLLRIPSTPSIV